MKAVVYEKGSAPGLLHLREVEKPVPGEGEVLVKIYAASVNAADSRSMNLGAIPKRKIFGSDLAGRVEAAGPEVKRFKIGDEVLGDISGCGMGGFAEYVAIPEASLAKKPPSLSFEAAAALPMAAVTALQGLRNLGHIRQGDRVLVYGAGGGVGTFAVQLAKHFGAEVTAVCGERNRQSVQSLGAGRVYDYMDHGVTQIGGGYGLVLVVNGSHPLRAYMRLLAKGGTCVISGGSLKQVIKAVLFGRLLSLGGRKLRALNAKPSAEDLAFVAKLAEEGSIRPVIDRRYPLADTAEAVRYQAEGHAAGKIVIQVA